MPLDVRAVTGAGATGPAMQGPLTPNLKNGVANAIGHVNSGNMFGGHPATFVDDVMGWRADRQNPPANHVNVSIQRNGIGAPSTVATVFVPTRLNVAPPPHGQPTDAHDARMKELTRVTRKGLNLSLASHNEPGPGPGWVITRYEVYGNFSA